jgi:hypothetical protein
MPKNYFPIFFRVHPIISLSYFAGGRDVIGRNAAAPGFHHGAA